MSLREKLNQNKDKNASALYKSYLQSYLSWLSLQNPSFSSNLTTEELVNYFLHDIELPIGLKNFVESNSFEILSKTYEYISQYQNKTEMFTIKNSIKPIKQGNYKEIPND